MTKPAPLVPLAHRLNAANGAQLTSYVLAAALCWTVLKFSLLPGLLAVCAGYLFAHALAGTQRSGKWRLSPMLAATTVIALPIIGIAVLTINAKGMAFGAVVQYQALLHHLGVTVLEIRQKLPPDLAAKLPDELIAAQKWLADYLQSQGHALTGFGTAGLRGGLLAYVGLIIGALMVGTKPVARGGALRLAVRQRGAYFIASFRQIVVAQFWIATFNAACTALFLLVLLPLANVTMPYAGSLVVLTFFAGLIPIVGNLLCNSVMTVAGVSVSPTVGLVCLLFLVLIHKFEYFINAKVVGKRTSTTVWELLAAMFAGEAIFGVAGLVAAPLYYAYVKKELLDAELI